MSEVDKRAHMAKEKLMSVIFDLIVLKVNFAEKVSEVAKEHDVNPEWLTQWAFENSKIEEESTSNGEVNETNSDDEGPPSPQAA